jgi:glycosyltransferase involved in cell wall biosynthesis
MHILITADVVGGVWTYARELVTGLIGRDVRVTLVSFGEIPSLSQTNWMHRLREQSDGALDYRPTAFKLEWMQDSAADMEASADYLRRLISETRPDLLHFNQFYYGALDCDLPRLVVAHSDVVSWWVAVHGQTPPQSSWLSWYRDSVSRGLEKATAVIAPSHWMLEQVERHYVQPRRASVIYNGRSPGLFNPYMSKEDRIVTVGRLWDRGKNAGLLLEAPMPAPVAIVGARHQPGTQASWFTVEDAGPSVDLQSQQDERQMAQILARASIYAAVSQYEPFGLAPVEAALSRCALVASDIPALRELWDGAAVFFRSNDAQDLRRTLELLVRDPALRKQCADLVYRRARERFHAVRMTDQYLSLYRALVPAAVAAA